jgi:ADP-L-glycero-D-manno-heptose 6-epimerase
VYVVTGGAGFIGANVVAALNARGERGILVVDNLERAPDKVRNLADLDIADYQDKREFRARLAAGALAGKVRAVLHQGACADTLEPDGRYLLDNNYTCSRELLAFCQDERIPLLYASSAAVYGAGTRFVEERACERPLNAYGYSKMLFDHHVRTVLPRARAQVAGFRYFNVYGPREAHKGRMASMAYQCYRQFRDEGHVRLFEGSGGYAAGEQRRDFIHVADLVATVLWFLDHPERGGIYNLGTGQAASFNTLATAVVNACRAGDGEDALDVPALVREGLIRYVPFPHGLAARYQSYTQADLAALRASGCPAAFRTVEQGVREYVQGLLAAA